MKCYYPAAFTAALLNSQPMGFYAPAQLVGDARKHGVEVLPVDVNHSEWDCTLEYTYQDGLRKFSPSPPLSIRQCEERSPAGERAGVRGPETASLAPLTPALSPTLNFHLKSKDNCGGEGAALRLGLRMLRGLSQVHADRIVECRRQGLFSSFDDFSRRTRLGNAVLKRLSKADAFGSLELERRQAMWQSLPRRESSPLYDNTADIEPAVTLPEMPLSQQIVADYQSAGLSLKGHPLQFLREMLDELQVVPTCRLADLPQDRRYKVAGLVLLRQRPGTAKGITFVTIEDETGTANLIVRQAVWERYHTVAARAGGFIASGRLQRAHDVIHLLVDRLEDMTALLSDLATRSRDFR